MNNRNILFKFSLKHFKHSNSTFKINQYKQVLINQNGTYKNGDHAIKKEGRLY